MHVGVSGPKGVDHARLLHVAKEALFLRVGVCPVGVENGVQLRYFIEVPVSVLRVGALAG